MKVNEFASQALNSIINHSRRHDSYVSADTSVWTASVFFLILVYNLVCYVRIETPFLIFMNKAFERYVVPTYTLVVLLYLTLAYIQYDLPFITKRPTPNKICPPKKREEEKVDRDSASRSIKPNSVSNDAVDSVISPGEEKADDSVFESKDENAYMPVNLSGVYKLFSNHNVEAFLEAQGVPWALRRAACSARPIHRIEHLGNSITITVEAGGSGAFSFKSQTTYIINGPPVETDVRGRIFHDRVTYLYDDDQERENGQERSCRGVLVTKRCYEENYTVTVKRELSDDKQLITLTSTATFAPELNKPPVVGRQIFERVE